MIRFFAEDSDDAAARGRAETGPFSAIVVGHAEIAWISMFSVALTDVYIRLVASGTISDWRIIGS